MHSTAGWVLAALACAVSACGPATQAPAPNAAPAGEWKQFEGTWSANGSRRTIALGVTRQASVIDMRGTLLLAGPGKPGLGFRSELIALVDSETGLTGRSLWTDEHGDRVYSALVGEGSAAQNRFTGTILGGTGRYAGATGTYEFSWQSVIEAEDGSIQGRAVGLKGRVHLGAPGPAGSPP